MSRKVEACEQRVRAAELSPNDYSLVVGAATALRLLDRKNDAETWYRMVSFNYKQYIGLLRVFYLLGKLLSLFVLRKAVQLRPNDARAHTNLGAILHLLGQSNQAADSYKQALQLQPNDSTTIANLAKLGIYGKV